MAKYSMECKLKIVREYLAGKGSYEALSKQHKIASGHIKTWVKVYEAFGAKGLERSCAQQTYTFEFKRSAVECYLSTEASYQEVAICLGPNNPSLLVRWTKQYRIGGVDALQEENLRLRIENAYLKELRRLRLQEAMQSKKQGSSAASEENFS